MSTRRRRILTSDEQALWAHVTQQVAPMAARAKARRKAAPPGEPEEPISPAVPQARQPSNGAGERQVSAKPQVKTPGKFEKPAWKRLSKAVATSPASPPASVPAPPAGPPLAPLERRLRQRLARGSHPIDAVIDLHGLRQDEAHSALRGFLLSAQRQGHNLVLVVTGKGGAPSASGSLFEERGVLRRTVPHWLRLPDLRSIVVGFEEAVQHHGGGGALYVRIRRARARD